MEGLSSDIWLILSRLITATEIYRLLMTGNSRLMRIVVHGIDNLDFEAGKFLSIPFFRFNMPRLRIFSLKMREDSIYYPLKVPNGRILPMKTHTSLIELRLAFAQSFWAFSSSKASFNLIHAFPNLTHLSLTESHEIISPYFFKQLPKSLISLELSNTPINFDKSSSNPLNISEIVHLLPKSLEYLTLSPMEGIQVEKSIPNMRNDFWPPNITHLHLDHVDKPDVLFYLPCALRHLHLTLSIEITENFPLSVLPSSMTSLWAYTRYARPIRFINTDGLPLSPQWRRFDAKLCPTSTQGPWDVLSWLPSHLESLSSMSELIESCLESMIIYDATAVPNSSQSWSFDKIPLPKSFQSLEHAKFFMVEHLPSELKHLEFSFFDTMSISDSDIPPPPSGLTALENLYIPNQSQLEWISSLKSLKTLDMSHSHDSAPWPIPENVLAHCLPKSLTFLSLDIANLSNVQCFMGISNTCPELEKLRISTKIANFQDWNPSDWTDLILFLPKSLKTLDMFVAQSFRKIWLNHWMPNLCDEFIQLKELKISGLSPREGRGRWRGGRGDSGITEYGEKSMPEWMKRLPKSLRVLDLSLLIPSSWASQQIENEDCSHEYGHEFGKDDNDHQIKPKSSKSSKSPSGIFHHLPPSLTELSISLEFNSFNSEAWKPDHFSRLPNSLTKFRLINYSSSINASSLLQVIPPTILHFEGPLRRSDSNHSDTLKQYMTRLLSPFFSRNPSSNLLSWLVGSKSSSESSSGSPSSHFSSGRPFASLWTSPERSLLQNQQSSLEKSIFDD